MRTNRQPAESVMGVMQSPRTLKSFNGPARNVDRYSHDWSKGWVVVWTDKSGNKRHSQTFGDEVKAREILDDLLSQKLEAVLVPEGRVEWYERGGE